MRMLDGFSNKRRSALLAVIVLAVLCCSVFLIVPGAVQAKSEKGLVAMSFGGLDIVLWNDILDLMRPMIEEHGYEMVTHDPQWNVTKQVNDWDAWIVRGVKAIMAWPIQVDALVPVTLRAREAGIPVIGYTQHWEGTTAAMLTKPYENGKRCGKEVGNWIAERFGDKPVEVGIIGYREADLTRIRTEAIIEGILEVVPNAQIYEQDAVTRMQGYDKTNSMLTAHPNLKIFASFGNDALLGTYNALLDHGVAVDDPDACILGMDTVNEVLDIMAIKNSIWRFCYAFTSEDLAIVNSTLLVKSADGENPEDMYVNPKKVTKDNLDEFYMGEYRKKKLEVVE